MAITGATFGDGTAANANTAVNGGAIYNAGTLTVTDSNFNGNTASGQGGAIYSTADATINATGANVAFTNNADGSGANDIYMQGVDGDNLSSLYLNAATDKSITLGSGINGTYYSLVVNNGTNGTVNAGNITDAKRITLMGGTFNAGDIAVTGTNTTTMVALGDVTGEIDSGDLTSLNAFGGTYNLTFNNDSSIDTLSMSTGDVITTDGAFKVPVS